MDEPVKRWRWLPEWAAWWLMLESGGTTAERVIGPFNESEAKSAAKEQGVPFPISEATH